MPLKARGGRLLVGGGHLCTTCCSSCSGPDCIDFGVLFPLVGSSGAPLHEELPQITCPIGIFTPKVTYRATVPNPIAATADLVVSVASLFDDDLRVDGVSKSGQPCGLNWTAPIGTVLASGVASGGSVVLTIVDLVASRTGASGCACWRPSRLTLSSAEVEAARVRFEICKACSETLQEGFECRLVSGCCFGRKRSDPAFACPRNLWPRFGQPCSAVAAVQQAP